eukprot:scaffold83934_cov14-Prasinocladus_malaysianus.AAC.2
MDVEPDGGIPTFSIGRGGYEISTEHAKIQLKRGRTTRLEMSCRGRNGWQDTATTKMLYINFIH